MQTAQDNDNLIKALKNFLLNKELSKDPKCQTLVRHFADKCFIENDVAWKRVKRKFEPSRVVIFLPESLVSQVLQEAHGHLLSGHDGIYKAKECLLQCYYWPGMDADIAQHIQHCHNCQASTLPLPIIFWCKFSTLRTKSSTNWIASLPPFNNLNFANFCPYFFPPHYFQPTGRT